MSATWALRQDRLNEVDEALLLNMFGNMVLSQYTLYKCVSAGINWGEVSEPLERAHWSNAVVMSFFTFFTFFSVMNIITGLFVDTAMKCAQNDHDEIIHKQLRSEDSTYWQMVGLFNDADIDASGTLTQKELDVHLKHRGVRAHLSALGLDISKAQGLFHLLDFEKTGEVEIEEFAMGCMRLMGTAQRVDIATLMYENKKMFHKMKSVFTFTLTQLQSLREGFDLMHKSVADIAVHNGCRAPTVRPDPDASQTSTVSPGSAGSARPKSKRTKTRFVSRSSAQSGWSAT